MIIGIETLFNENKKTVTFSEIFKAPEGYSIDKLLLTTFTMSKRILADIYMHYASEKDDISINDMSEIQKRIFLQEAFVKYHENIDIYVQEDQILSNISSRKLEGLDEFISGKLCTVHKVKKPENGFFHPKIALVSYCNLKNENVYKLYVSSKNLTYDTFFQTGIMLKGETGSDGNKNGECLRNFIKSFAGESFPEWLEKIKKVSFYNEKPGDVSLLFFVPDNNQNENNITIIKNDFKEPRACLFFSDSIRKDFFENIFGNDENIECVAVSNSRSWAKAIKKGEDILPYAYILDSNDPPYIHSKMYFVMKDDGRMIYYVGSANCTWSALQNNYEMMVRVVTNVNGKEDSFTEIKGSTQLKWKKLEDRVLEEARKKESILECIKNMKVVCYVSKENESISMELVVGKPDKYLEIKRLILCLPNDYHRYDIIFEDDKFELSLNNVRWSRLPFEKKALVFVDSEMGKGTVDINIELICPKEIKDGITPKDSKCEENLFKGHLPAVREAIPAVSRKYKGFYHVNDTDDIRIAKYIAYCREEKIKDPYENIMKRCDDLLGKCSSYSDMDEEDEFSDSFDAEGFNKELEVAKNKIKKLKELLEVRNNG